MNKLPFELKLTYIIAIFVMIFFVGFIILVVFLYNKKQNLYIKERQLQAAHHQNQLQQTE